MTTTLVPCYGRDYRNKKDLLADWMAGKDFRIQSFGHPHDGRVMNRSQASPGEVFHIRYKQLAQIAVVKA